MIDSQTMPNSQNEEEENEYPSRPPSTKELVSRFENPKTSLKEKEKALKPLVEEMIKIFRDDRKLSHTLEAAALAPVLAGEEYRYLALALGDAVCQGVGDGNALNPQLLDMFISVLWRAEETQITSFQLGPILKNLRKRLNSAVEQAAAHQIQYQIVCALSSVLEAMYQVGTTGLSREAIHSPLRNQLSDLCKSTDLCLAQAATCAYQALLGIPDNEGPYRTLWRSSLAVVGGIAKVASVAVNLDPSKLVEGVADLANIPEMVSSAVESIQELNSMAQGLKLPQKQKIWHVALRFTNTLIQDGTFNYLTYFIEKLPCLQDKEFLCGICAQLEPVWDAGDTLVKEKVITFWQQFQPLADKSTHERVHAWVDLTARTLGQPEGVSISRLQPQKKNKYTSETTFRKTGNIAVGGDLLRQAWSRCTKAQVFYADMRIRQHYLQDGRLLVERLSGKPLPIDLCYINLAIMKGSAKDQQSSGSSLSARLKVETPPEDTRVQLESLFVKREDSKDTSLKRILIRGQAGVGKSTLCKKMVHNYLKQGMWTEMFDRVLWVPLRSLKLSYRAGYNLYDWLRDEYFRVDSDDDRFIPAMKEAIVTPNEFGRTLFILDGLDEVSGELSSQTGVTALIMDFLRRPDVIITSRPGMSLPARVPDVNLEVETVGFYPGQVNDYIRASAPHIAEAINSKHNIAKAKSTREAITSAIQQFIQQHWIVRGLVRIPIQLEALCYSWDDAGSKAALTTMTALYQAIELKLWRKDAVRLKKTYHNKLLDAAMANEMFDDDVLDLVRQENCLLEGLAFTGLCANVIEIDKEYRYKIRKHWDKIAGGPLNFLDLTEMSFMRSSDVSLDRQDRSYHFLHLTFQEYFAAKYFVDRWTADPPRHCPVFCGSKITSVHCEDFLLKEKYTERFDIFWRFVAGLLQRRDGPETQLCRFFDTIEKEPLDLLGPTHQRLVMHCLSEVESPLIRTQLELRLTQWIILECDHTNTSFLAREAECPDEVVRTVLGSERGRRGMLNALGCSYVHVSATTAKALMALLNDTDSDIQRRAAIAIKNQSHLPSEAITALVVLLKDKNSDNDIRMMACKTLLRQPQLPLEAITTLLALFKDDDTDIQSMAFRILVRQPQLPLDAATALVSPLKDKDSSSGFQLIHDTLTNHCRLPRLLPRLPPRLSPEFIIALRALLSDKDSNVLVRAAYLLSLLSRLPSEATTPLVVLFKDKDPNIQRWAVETLRHQSQLPSEAIAALVALLKDKDSCIQASAAKALRNQSQLPSEIITALMALLMDKDSNIQISAATALSNLSQMPSEAIAVLLALLKNKDSNRKIRQRCAEALSCQSQLPSEAITALVALLKDKYSYIHLIAATALRNQSQLPSEIITALMALLMDKESNSFMKKRIIEALKDRSLSSEAITAFVALFKNKDRDVRIAPYELLKAQSQLPSDAVTALIELLMDNDDHVQRLAIQTIDHQLQLLPSEAITALVLLVLKGKDDLPYIAAKTLESKVQQLPLEAITAIVVQLRGNDTYARRRTADVLNRGSQLLDSILEATGFLLPSEDFAEPPRSICNIEFVEGLYGVWLQRSFQEPSSLYIDNNGKGKGEGKACIVLNRQNGTRKAIFENESQQEQFLNVIKRGRQLWVDQQRQGIWGDDVGTVVQDAAGVQDTAEGQDAVEAHPETEVDTNVQSTPDTKGQSIFISWLLYFLYGILKALPFLAEKWMKKMELNDDDAGHDIKGKKNPKGKLIELDQKRVDGLNG